MNETLFLNLILEHQAIIQKICRLYRDSLEDREDLFQEIIYQLWRAIPSFNGKAKVSTWLYRVALNTAIASFRKKSPKVSYVDTLPDLPEATQSEELAIRQERLFAALKQLDDSEKAIVALYLDDLSYQQIAEITGINENYVGVRLNRIKNKLQKLLTK